MRLINLYHLNDLLQSTEAGILSMVRPMSHNISISVVIPTYNRASQLDRCLSSLFKQDYPFKYEVVVVDDDSNDETCKMLERRSREHPNMTVIRNTKNKGPSYSRNLGVDVSKGDIVAFVDSDCIIPRDWLSKIHKAFQNNEVSCIQGTHERLGKWELPIPRAELLSHSVFSTRKGLGTGNLAIRKDVIHKYKFDARFRVAEDQDLGHRLAESHINVLFDPNIWVTHIDTRGFWQTISKGKPRGEGYALLLKKHGWKSVNPKLKYPMLVLFLYYLIGFFYLLPKYRSFRGATTTVIIDLFAALHFKMACERYTG